VVAICPLTRKEIILASLSCSRVPALVRRLVAYLGETRKTRFRNALIGMARDGVSPGLIKRLAGFGERAARRVENRSEGAWLKGPFETALSVRAATIVPSR